MIRFAFKSTTLEGLRLARPKKKQLSTKESATTLATARQADETQVGRLVRMFWNKPGER